MGGGWGERIGGEEEDNESREKKKGKEERGDGESRGKRGGGKDSGWGGGGEGGWSGGGGVERGMEFSDSLFSLLGYFYM